MLLCDIICCLRIRFHITDSSVPLLIKLNTLIIARKPIESSDLTLRVRHTLPKNHIDKKCPDLVCFVNKSELVEVV